jgi:hypothetical protein
MRYGFDQASQRPKKRSRLIEARQRGRAPEYVAWRLLAGLASSRVANRM